MKDLRKALFRSILALMLCFSMLVGTTYAWFTDTETSANNRIVAGNLDIEFDYWNGTSWKPVKDSSEILDGNAKWEPGYTDVVYLRVQNAGNLALKYQLGVNIIDEKQGVNVNGQVFSLSDYIYFDVVDGAADANGNAIEFATRGDAMAEVVAAEAVAIRNGYSTVGELAVGAQPVYLAMIIYMPTTVGNEANSKTGEAYQASIDLGLSAVATQLNAEEDAFGPEYDKPAVLPVVESVYIPANSITDTAIEASDVTVTVPANSAEGVYSLNVSNKGVKKDGNLTTVSYDITLSKDGVKVQPDGMTTYTVAIEVGKNLTGLVVKHNGETVDPIDYDPAVGVVSFETDSFSPFSVTFEGTYVEKDENTPSASVGQSVKTDVTLDNENKVAEEKNIVGDKIAANVPVGVKADKGVTELNLAVSSVDESNANITLEENEVTTSIDVHITGVAEDNTTPIAITINELLPTGLNSGNFKLYHVENGRTIEMTCVDTLTAHNQFTYDPATGDVTLYMATFSEIAVVADTENVWNGTVATSFAGGSGTEADPYIIANADQLAYLNELISNENDAYGSAHYKHYKLVADINLGGEDNANNGIVFYPIGYHKVGGTIATVDLDDAPVFEYHEEDPDYAIERVSLLSDEGTTKWYEYGGAFKGVFDGNGHTIKNIYQNTWQLKGNYDGNYWNAAMGVFGYVYGGTVKNLTVDNFSSDGEFTPTGVIAAYAAGDATFENIAITNCNPRVYNTGNGGIIGIAGDTRTANDDHITLRNITVDNTNKISALWGSWDVACGGLVGMYRGNVDGNGNATGDTISFKNCHVAAQIDVYNDVCANYQYYAYRYSGMIIGSVRHNTTNDDGRTIPNMTGISAEACTVHFGTWNDYYYCELVDNTTASYTHDYQMSRLVEIKAINGTTITYLDGTTGTVPASGRANYVIVDYSKGHGTENATCYHFKNGEVWTHDMGGIQTGVDENGDGQDDLKEDKQHLYLEFNNLFTGYGWGVSSMGIDKWNGITKLDVGLGQYDESVEKFAGASGNSYTTGKTVTIGELFSKIENAGVPMDEDNVQVTVSPAEIGSTASATYVANTSDWKQGTLTFSGVGKATITITDYYFCIPTTIIVQVLEHQHVYDNACDTTCNDCEEVREITHEYTSAVTAPTCTEKGYTTYTCACGDTYIDKETEALGHSYDVDKTEPTCTAAGYSTYTCTVCDHSYVADEVAATGHSHKADVTDPTCTEKGYTTYTCACGDTYTSNEVAATGHITTNFTGDFLYRVGNQNDVPFGSLFNVGKHNVTVSGTKIAGNASVTVNGTTLTFSGTGIVKVTLENDCTCGECVTELILEVVDAVNATGATDATSNNVVLLNDAGLSSLAVSGRYTFYGNGFTLTYTGNGQYLGKGSGFKFGVVNVSENGTLDNVRIKSSVYPIAAMFSDQIANYYVEEGGKTRYLYQLSAVAISGDATLSNCYIYGGRNNVYVGSGNVTIKDTVLENGTLSNIQIVSSNEYIVTFENLTTIQTQTKPTTYANDTLKDNTMLGFGVLVGEGDADKEITNPKIIIKGDLKQYNWVTDADKKAVTDTYAQQAIDAALSNEHFVHLVNNCNASNLGIIYLNNLATEADIVNESNLPYVLGDVKITVVIKTINGKAYSLSGATENQIYSNCAAADRTTVNGLYVPQFKYDSTLGGQYVAEGGDGHCYREGDTIRVMFPSGDSKEIDLAKLVDIAKYGKQDLGLEVVCKDSNGKDITISGNKITLSTAGTYTVTYTVTDTLFYNKDGEKVNIEKKYSWDVSIEVSLKDTAIQNAYFEFDSSKQLIYRSGNSNIVQFIPFLAGLKIYDYNGQTRYLRFDGDNDFNKVAKASIENINTTGEAQGYHIVTVEFTDGGKLVIDMDVRANSGSSTHSGSIKVRNNVLYVVNGGTTSGKGQTWKIYSYKFVGNNGTEINSGAVTFGKAGVDCDTATKPSSNFGTSIKYTVTYDANGGNCGQTTGYATSAATAVTLPTPTRSGYIFAGWYTAASGGTRVGGAGESYTPSANITLYAQWGKPCDVTYDANGGSCGTASEKYTGTALTLPTPTRDGYWFIGWYDAAEGGNKIGDAGATYNPTGEMTLYAHWQEAIKYTVTYNANGGSCGTASATYEGTALTLPTPARTGYTFNGWYTAASGGTKIGGAGESYIPSANITLYAQWTINSYKVTVSTSNATVKVNGTTVNNNGTVSIQYGAQVTVEVTYSESDDRSTTIKGADGTTYTSPFNMPAQDVTINATSSSCITPDTLITLADGSQARVDSLTGDEMLLVWNMETGMLDSAPIMFLDSESEAEYEVVHLYFSDGTDVKVIYEHGFWDYDLNRYVYLDSYAGKYIGHTFAKQNGEELAKVKLVDVVIETEYTTAWSPVTVGHLCYFVNGMLSMPGGVGGLFNIFEVDPETMTYDYDAIAADIEKYGLFTYEELNAIAPLSEAMFNEAGGAYLKISIGKGNLTMEELVAMINRYSKFFD